MSAKPIDIPYRGEVHRIYALLAAREGRWSPRFLALYLGGDVSRLPPRMAEDAKEIRDAIKTGRPVPAWCERRPREGAALSTKEGQGT